MRGEELSLALGQGLVRPLRPRLHESRHQRGSEDDRDHAGHYNLVHGRELKRLRAELDARQDAQRLGIGAMIGGLKRRLGKRPE